ncbi:MAG: SCO family protein [Pseudomonadota bacterium]
MNSIAKSPLATSILAAAALALSACEGAAVPAAEPPLAGAPIGGEFELSNTAGETVRWADFEGRYRIVYFGYAYCPDICPTDVQRTIQGLDQFSADQPDRAAKVQPIFISIDPERDTPEVIDQFTSAFSDDLIGLTGTPEQLKATAKTFASTFSKLPETADGSYLMDHTRSVLLFDPAGKPLALLPADEGADAVTQELAKWVS